MCGVPKDGFVVASLDGLAQLKECVDSVIAIPNDRLLQIADKRSSLQDAFRLADDVLHQGIQGISELITVPGLINLDFADIEATMRGAGTAIMGIGEAPISVSSPPGRRQSFELAIRRIGNVTAAAHRLNERSRSLLAGRQAAVRWAGWSVAAGGPEFRS